MNRDEKRNYNREHYKKNRELILSRSKSRNKRKGSVPQNVISLFGSSGVHDRSETGTSLEPPAGSNSRRRKRARWSWGTFFLHLLVLGMTCFLIGETAQFYASTEGGTTTPYLKAILLEGGVLAFSLIRAKGRANGMVQKVMIALIYSFSIWIASGTLLHNASQERQGVALHAKAVAELETEITHQTALRTSLFNANRLSMGLKVEHTLKDLRQKLEQSRSLLVQMRDITVIWNTVLSLVMFRILIMASNLFCLKELDRRYRMRYGTV